ncbi:MAG: hypothetical protein AAGG01_19265, partial [Planctomycetota bacterium]
RGEEIVLRTEEGALIGTVSPFGATAREAGGSYAVPILDEFNLSEGLRVLVSVEDRSGASRTPKAAELVAIRWRRRDS